MKNFAKIAMAAMVAASAMSANAGRLWIVGDGVHSGWDLDGATALLSTAAEPEVYTGTVYLYGGKDFKFLTTTDWGGLEYGSAEGTTGDNGVTALASGTSDTGYGKLTVAENANYLLTVNLTNMAMTAVKSDYQQTEITDCSLFMIGDATEGGWSVDEGTPLYQQAETPYVYKSGKVALKAGSFKIATTIKGGGTFNQKYYYFRDADNAGKIALDQDGDLQWQIAEADDYLVDVNTAEGTISISKSTGTGVGAVGTVAVDETEEYYTLQGIKVSEPASGLYIRVRGTQREKIVIK